jgi:hypothetical protein
MSFHATKFVRQLRGLSPEEKAVAFVLADHDDHKGNGAYPSMETVAREAGLKRRETASRITARLVRKGIFLPAEPPTREQGRPTVYRPNYAFETCDSPVTGPPTQPVTVNRKPVTLEGQTCDSPVTQRVEGRREKPYGGEAPVQLSNLSQLAAEKKPHGHPPWVKGQLAEDLYRGIHNRKLTETFFDARKLPPREQLKECVHVAVTSVLTNRVATLKDLSANEVEDRAFHQMLAGLVTLEHVKDFSTRRRHTVQAVTRVVIETCMQMLGQEVVN